MKRLLKQFISWINEDSVLVEAVKADVQNWKKEKTNKMSKYRIVKSYRYINDRIEKDFSEPGYVIQEIYIMNAVSSTLGWRDMYQFDFKTEQAALDSLELHIGRKKIEDIPDEVVRVIG